MYPWEIRVSGDFLCSQQGRWLEGERPYIHLDVFH